MGEDCFFIGRSLVKLKRPKVRGTSSAIVAKVLD